MLSARSEELKAWVRSLTDPTMVTLGVSYGSRMMNFLIFGRVG